MSPTPPGDPVCELIQQRGKKTYYEIHQSPHCEFSPWPTFHVLSKMSAFKRGIVSEITPV